jgi:hypothetical protein
MSEVRKRTADNRGQRSEVRRQKTDSRQQKSEDRGQIIDRRSQMTEVRRQKTENRQQKSEIKNQITEKSGAWISIISELSADPLYEITRLKTNRRLSNFEGWNRFAYPFVKWSEIIYSKFDVH